ncbi:DUF418 domain-containing protein [Bacillus sp. BGMRC 2118]|nr:DUF418 domain-containing protein [Bacillus sp. BGMRC 2118]
MNNRVHSIDGIRGLSLFGILAANMLIFQYGIWGKDEITHYSLSQFDLASLTFIKVVIEGSFMPIFTFLFGYGMIKMKETLSNKGKKVKRHFVRRSVFLLIIGGLHATYLWEGDILSFYGIMILFLLLFLNRKKKTILIWGLLLLTLTPLIGYGHLEETKEDKELLRTYVVNTIDIYGTGNYFEIKDQRNNEFPLNFPDYVYFIILMFVPWISAPLFLLGMYAAKIGYFHQPKKEASVYKICALIFIPLGLLLKSASHLSVNENWIGVSEILGANILALGYISSFALLYVYAANSFILRGLEAVGKLSFTNYLMQTVICTSIFYGYGLGYFGKLGVFNGFLLSIFIFTIQMVTSTLYLNVFQTGPLEKLIRIWTYVSIKGKPKQVPAQSEISA